MKRLVGGDYLLDLTPIDIEESVDVETYTNITNTEVITQLTNLKKYVSNPSMIKPVWVELKNGETDELVVARGEFKVVGDGEFEIVIQLDGYKLKIHVEFTQVLNERNDPLDDWFIDTNDAKYLFTSDTQNIGDIIGTGGIDNAKPIYWHTIKFQRGGTAETANVSRIIGMMIILTNSSEPITLDNFIDLLKIDGFYGVVINGKGSTTHGSDLTGMVELLALKYKDQNSCTAIYRNPTSNVESEDTINLPSTSSWVYFEDLGANKIN